MKEQANKAKSKILLDVGGTRFATAKTTLLAFKDSYFSAMVSSSNWQPDEDGSYFIDRNPKYFSIILDYMRHGMLNIDRLTSGDLAALYRDMDYFQIPIPQKQGIFTSSKIIRQNTKVICSGLALSTQGNWANVILETGPNISYWEMNVLCHLGDGHLRVGICNSLFDLEKMYPGQTAYSIGLHLHGIDGYGSIRFPQGLVWNANDRIGVLFDKPKACVNFYLNGTMVGSVKNIPNPQDWSGIFCVHCTQDQLSLVQNPQVPKYE